MARKEHLAHTSKFGPVCKAGKMGAALRGEHITSPYAEFVQASPEHQCAKCKASSLFSFLSKQAAKQAPEAAPAQDWEPEEGDWFARDQALIAARKARK